MKKTKEMTRMSRMSTEQLKALSLEKGKNGCATKKALAAQRRLFVMSYGAWGAFGFDAYGREYETCSRQSLYEYDEPYD